MRFDNFTVAGSAVPAPAGAIALLALAGCAARRRR
jgi:MYXO-CTERM domain-containing protein